MKSQALLAWGAYLCLLSAPMGVLAHHAFAAEFDREQPLEITGRVSNVEWMNPHARVYIDAADASGEVITWNFELGGANVLMRRGLTGRSLRLGDVITVTGFRARDDPHVANAATVTLANGKEVFVGSSAEGS